MSFVRSSANRTPIVDTVFGVAVRAKQDKAENGDLVVDATIGSLFDEEGSFAAFDSVFDHYDAIDHRTKGAYAASYLGNPDFRTDVYDWLTQDTEVNLAHSVLATPGGSGAVATAFRDCLDPGETVIIPDIGWTSYEIMASQNNLHALSYEVFEGDHFNIRGLKEAIGEVRKTQNRVVLVINDPCHNPTGYSLSLDEWQAVVDLLNEAGKDGPVVLINDIAYIDYSSRGNEARAYLSLFNNFNNQVMAVIAFSCSKLMTSYGLRCGAAVILAKEQAAVDEAEVVFEKTARAVWSNIPNAAMANFCWVVEHNRDAFLAEKQSYIDLLKQRSDLFLSEAKACGLETYPYKEGFFITVRMANDADTARLHEALMNEHIYTVTVHNGIRIAVCSLPLRKIKGLAQRIRTIKDQTIGKGL